jgi:hypothetical protein
MAKRTVKVKIPVKSPDAMLALGKAIIKKHKADGAASQLTGGEVDMTAYETNVNKADQLRAEAEDLHNQAEKKMQAARQILGIDAGQTINSVGTTYSDTDILKDRLLLKNRGNEEALSVYGFDVVVGTAKSPTKKPK